MGVMFLQQHDGLPTPRLEPRVDAVRFRRDFFQKNFVPVNFGPARRSYLHKSEAMVVSGKKIQEVLDGPEPLDDPFRVIETVNAHAQQATLHTQLTAQSRTLLTRISCFVYSVTIFRKGHTDRI